MSTTPLAVITGASTGIGLELARELASRGYDLVICADEPQIDYAAAEVADGTTTMAVQADLATEEGVQQLIDRVRGLGRPVDVLALNAGVATGGPFLEVPWRDDARLVALNINHVLAVAKDLLPDMVQRGSGRVLITSSIAGTMPGPWYATYAASKAFLHSFAEGLRFELRETGVTVTSLLPGPTETEFFDRGGMQDTEVYEAKKDDPAQVARDGVEAMLKGEDSVVGGSFKNRLQALASNLLPEPVKARVHSQMTKKRDE
ncbi:SDR family NAD(P)-dependent oxidoreductase [Ornithinimicrobium pratense]|uniref:SDR family NAD(P)-dependent oxidoreductase n=1 Tax=Ornithinimicrobium pratense TaxID=2593973 RepID=A0A5J6V1A6_9MICO|nr:SDR family NAD(P)-dependent oxidoreductase [Ornithinimicrobium pratense]QFG67519.1 SDR family NAD(P)-dependent oxidoreductase [Ornithinimicrobium pratense]